jgi:hypothetical protein
MGDGADTSRGEGVERFKGLRQARRFIRQAPPHSRVQNQCVGLVPPAGVV